MKTLAATVEAVCLSTPGVRVAKTPQDEAFLGPYGFAGDRHEAEYRLRPYSGGHVANKRQWSAVSTGEVEAVCADLGVRPFAIGALGENLRLCGVILADLPAGTALEFPSGARALVSGKNEPCVAAANELMKTYGGHVGIGFVKTAFGRRGILGTVLEPGLIRPRDSVRILVPEQGDLIESVRTP
ncbi:MAG TPA: MOSC domain-containing protein [Dehalococcoidia bacterium]|nr:MOSC domain-containing protein [Dehalococcoidia bacterium]